MPVLPPVTMADFPLSEKRSMLNSVISIYVPPSVRMQTKKRTPNKLVSAVLSPLSINDRFVLFIFPKHPCLWLKWLLLLPARQS